MEAVIHRVSFEIALSRKECVALKKLLEDVKGEITVLRRATLTVEVEVKPNQGVKK